MLYQHKDKNAAEVNIAPASDKIIKYVKYRSRALGQCMRLKAMSRRITMQRFTFAATLDAEKKTLTYKLIKSMDREI